MNTPAVEDLPDPSSADRRRTLLAVAMILVIVASCVFLYFYLQPHQTHLPIGIYYANEETGELSVQPVDAVPPLLDAAGNPVLVRTCMYSTDGGKTKTVAYYEKYSDAVKAMMAAGAQDPSKYDDRLFKAGLLVRLPAKDSPWVPADSQAGRKVIASFPQGPNITGCSLVAR